MKRFLGGKRRKRIYHNGGTLALLACGLAAEGSLDVGKGEKAKSAKETRNQSERYRAINLEPMRQDRKRTGSQRKNIALRKAELNEGDLENKRKRKNSRKKRRVGEEKFNPATIGPPKFRPLDGVNQGKRRVVRQEEKGGKN